VKGGDLVLKAFDSLGGSPTEAVMAAGSFDTTAGWIRSQTAQAAAIGAGTMIIPGVHLLAFGLDLGLVMHKVAYTTWGVGRLHECTIDGKLDLALVLAVWTNTIDDAMLTRAAEVSALGMEVGQYVIGGPTAFLVYLISEVSGESATTILATLGAMGGLVTAGRTADFLVGKAAEHSLPYYGKKIMTKISAKVAAKLASATAGKLIPIVGAVVTATVNAIIVRTVGAAAIRFYTAKRIALAARQAIPRQIGPDHLGG
jgi:hypothetical protein